MSKQWRRILSVIMCIALVLSTNTNVIALTADWEFEAPSLDPAASEVKLDAAVKKVIKLIDEIGTVEYTAESLTKIVKAENAYAALNDEQKLQVNNYGTLKAARNAYDNMAADKVDTSSYTVVDSGVVNSVVKWYVYDNGVLEFDGEGAIPTYAAGNAPWYAYRLSVTKIIVRSNVTAIGEMAFNGFNNLKKITLPFVGASRTATNRSATLGYLFGYTTTTRTGSNSSDYKYFYNIDNTWNNTTNPGYTSSSQGFLNFRVVNTNAGSTYNQNVAWYTCRDYYYSAYSEYYYQTYYFNIPTSLTSVTITDASKIEVAAFNNCKYITELNINEGVESIGNYAFQNNVALKEIVLPESIVTVGNGAFSKCSSINEIYFSDKVQTIGWNSFSDCSSLARINIGENVSYIGVQAFINCTKLDNVTIPNSVKTIDEGAFRNCSKLKQLKIKSGVEKINIYAFYGCKSLVEVIIPDSVTILDDYAFSNCSGLCSITIGSSVKTIGERAFSSCSSLKSLTIPNNVEKIEVGALEGCTLSEVKLPFVGQSREAINMAGTFGYIFGYTTTTRTSSNNSDYKYFYNIDNTWNNTTSPGYASSSHGFSNFRVVNTNAGSTYNQNVAWYTCRDYYYSAYSEYYYQTYYFNIPTSLTSVTITDASKIETAAFNNCKYITELNLNEGIESIGYCAFQNNIALRDIVIPESMNTIGSRAFYNCDALVEIAIPDNVGTISSYAFYNCNTLKNIEFGSNTKTIGEYAFYDCDTLTEIIIPDSVTKIDNYAFSGSGNINKLTLSKNLVTIGNHAFNGCRISTIDIPNEVVSIGEYAFAANSSAKSILFGDSVKDIGAYAFSGCSGLKSVVVPNNVQTIGVGAFEGTSSLQEISVPFVGQSRVAINMAGTFGYIFGYTTTTRTGSNSSDYKYFYNIDNTWNSTSNPGYTSSSPAFSNFRVVNAHAASTYKQDYSWYTCRDYYYSAYSEYYYQTYYFNIPTTLKTVNITDASKIDTAAFNNCRYITDININDKVTTVNSYAFQKNNWYEAQKDEFVIEGDGVLIKYNGTKSGVVIPEDVKYIASRVFANNTTVSEVTLPNTLKGIGASAFAGCTNLSALTIPKSVTSIGSSAIPSTCVIYVYRPSAGYDYRSANRVILNESYTTGKDTFYYVVKDNGKIEIIGCVTTSTEITVPTDINGIVVDEIGDYGFKNCTTINSITIPSNILNIGEYAFVGCTGLINATIPTTVNKVGDYAFKDCTGLVNVTISEGVESIGKGAFYNCVSLVEAVVPDTAKTVGAYAFYNCNSMTTATIGITADAIGDYTFYGCEKLDTIVIGISVESIGDYAFYDCALTKVTVPAATKIIGKYAFTNNTEMTKVTLRKGIETIDNHAFENCSSMQSINFPSSVLTIGNASFKNCAALSSMSLPTSLTTLGYSAFENCASIPKIVIPEGVTIINDKTFLNCTSLADVTINSDATEIGDLAFMNCAFAELVLPETLEHIGDSAFRGCANVINMYLPDAVVNLGESAFLDCAALTTVSIPDSLAYVGEYAFSNTNSLTVTIRFVSGTIAPKIMYEQDIVHVVMEDGITEIGDYAFAYCRSLEDFIFSKDLTTIGDYAFYDNDVYSELRLPSKVETIGTYAFAESDNLRTLYIPDTVNIIGSNAFYHCYELLVDIYLVDGTVNKDVLKGQNACHIFVEDNITTLEDGAFANCAAIETISLPDTISSVGSGVFTASSGNLIATIRGVDGTVDPSVYDGKTNGIYYVVFDENIDTIGAYAFANSNSIKGVVINETSLIDDYAFYNGTALNYIEIGTTETIDTYAFAECVALKRVEIDVVRAINDYAFFNCISMNDIYIDSESGLQHIGEHTFEECKLMPKIVLPATVRNIGAYAFYNCNSMTYINIPDGVPAINDYTFFGCASLKEMLLPNSVITIGDYAFYGCVVVKNMTLGDQTKAIGEYAFYNCNQIVSLDIPNTVTTIGDYAFRSCSSIKELFIPDSVIELGDCVFYSCTGLEQVEFGTGITTIGDRVFYACVELDKVVFNAPVTEIHDLAFYGAEDATLYAFEDEYVETYCNDYGLAYYNLNLDFELVLTGPSKTTYNEYEELDLSDLALKLTYSNGTERTIKTGYTVSGYDSSVLGDQTVTITYNGKSASFDVTVAAKVVQYITITAGAPTSAIVGEELDYSNMVVTVTFTDSTSIDITEGYTVAGYDANVLGEQMITVTYREGSQDINVTVNDYVRGDTNGDGLVTMKDVTRLVNYLNDASIAVIDKALDVNGDGYVTIKDVTRLTEYLEDNTVEIF